MNTTATDLIFDVPGAAGNRDVTRQHGQRGDLLLGANHEGAVEESEASKADGDRTNQRAKFKRKQQAEPKTNQLPEDPFQWVGMRVRRKKDAAIFTVHTVFANQRVGLKKSWMIYTSDVPTVRAGYEPCI